MKRFLDSLDQWMQLPSRAAVLTLAFSLIFALQSHAFAEDVEVTFSANPPKLALSVSLSKPGTSEYRTKKESLSMALKGASAGESYIAVNNRSSVKQTVTSATTSSIKLQKETANTVTIFYSNSASVPPIELSQSFRVVHDAIGPQLQRCEVIDFPDTGKTILVTFLESDLGSIDPSAFSIKRQAEDGMFSDTITTQRPMIDGRQVRLPVGLLPAGQYQLTIDPSKIKDSADNSAQGIFETTFSALPGRQFGEQVEFPPFAPPAPQARKEGGFNPGDFVETRVARLFYFRDAERVAQIINRNVRSYNQSAVTYAERRAESARDRANDATDERRSKERKAVQAADQARQVETKLADAERELAAAEQLDRAVIADTAEKTFLDGEIQKLETIGLARTNEQNEQLRLLQMDLELVNRRLAQSGSKRDQIFAKTSDLATNVGTLRQQVANARDAELNARDAWNDAQAREERTKATQFRSEVTAAETDPDTYVAGNPNSIDPVAQVSVSVIGEGLLQLRGPIKGINKIRTMINQIDSPVGQIKVGIFSVQVNGEKGEEMERVVGDAESSIDLSRFLVNQSLNLLRRAIQSEAAILAEQCEHNGHYQVDRDRRYLYSFFGRDFIDELYEMNSEFMFSENKLLSLHSMDTVSFNRAMFILALAKNDVRERIVSRFLESAKTELPDAEFDFRRSSEFKPHRTQKKFPPWNLTHLPLKNRHKKEEIIHEAVHRNAMQRYHFRNFSSYFDTGFVNSDTMNPMQREFIRLAQMFKARLVAEMEWKQRVLERGLIEDHSNDEVRKAEIMKEVHAKALEFSRESYLALIKSEESFQDATLAMGQLVSAQNAVNSSIEKTASQAKSLGTQLIPLSTAISQNNSAFLRKFNPELNEYLKDTNELKRYLLGVDWLNAKQKEELAQVGFVRGVDMLPAKVERFDDPNTAGIVQNLAGVTNQLQRILGPQLSYTSIANTALVELIAAMQRAKATKDQYDEQLAVEAYNRMMESLDKFGDTLLFSEIRQKITTAFSSFQRSALVESSIQRADALMERTRVDLDHRKLLNHLIDEQEERFIELVEGTRSHIAVLDQYLKRLSIALEDDFKIQFYDPAFVRVREASRGRSVNLSQVERTTVLTNNRAFAKVDPQATMEFDLPKRQIAIKEAFSAAKALVEDSGALMNDPTFLSAFQMMGGSVQPGTVKNLLPGQSMSLNQQDMGLAPQSPYAGIPGSALQNLVPEPSVFKLETGTGFQLRPVMQPDGDSAVYDFDYMYTTNIREPVRADEKHIGRVKRHFVHTAVQTGNFELREVSRYQVALKVSRTSRGVPLLEDIPVVGAVFRPAPSDESSLQQNIIFGQTNLYPTVFDLMGLRWAQQVVDLSHESLLEAEHVVRGRQRSMRNFVFGEASSRVDRFLDIPNKSPENYRTDFYREQVLPSPHHPRGYSVTQPISDPTGRNYERYDPRPPEMQDPPYDLYRHRPASPESISPGAAPERIPPRSQPLQPIQLEPQKAIDDYYLNPLSDGENLGSKQIPEQRIPEQGPMLGLKKFVPPTEQRSIWASRKATKSVSQTAAAPSRFRAVTTVNYERPVPIAPVSRTRRLPPVR